MKKLYSLLALAGVLAAPNVFAAFDGTVQMSDSTFHNTTTGGGEFTAASSGFGTFQTFCLEQNENLLLDGGSYNYFVNSGAVKGGIAGQDATDSHTGLSMDNLSIGTAYLFSHFAAGNLANYNFGTGPGDLAAHLASAGALATAIYWLEDEQTGSAPFFVTQAEGALGLDDTTIKADAKGSAQGTFGVLVLNLYDGSPTGEAVTFPDGTVHHLNQDILAVPEPTTMIAGALLLLPFGASTLRSIRRNRI